MLQRFDFNHLRDFRGPIVARTLVEVEAQEQAAPPAPPPPMFNEAELLAAQETGKKLGYAEGVAEGLRQAASEKTQREADAAAAVGKVAVQVERLVGNYRNLVANQSKELSQLITVIAKKVAGDALRVRDTEVILELVSRCLPVFFEKPRIVVELHPDTLDNARDVILPFLTQKGFEGDVIFRSNSTIGLHDTRIDWGQGEAVRSTDQMWRDIEQLLTTISLTPNL